MNRTALFATSFVAALPAGFLVFLLVMAFLQHFDKMSTSLQALSGLALLVAMLVAITPAGIMIFGGPKGEKAVRAPKEKKEKPKKEKKPKKGKKGKGEVAAAESVAEGEFAESGSVVAMSEELVVEDEDFDMDEDLSSAAPAMVEDESEEDMIATSDDLVIEDEFDEDLSSAEPAMMDDDDFAVDDADSEFDFDVFDEDEDEKSR